MTHIKQARLQAGLTLEQVAKASSVSVGHLRRIERLGGCSIRLAERLSRLYRCHLNLFLLKS